MGDCNILMQRVIEGKGVSVRYNPWASWLITHIVHTCVQEHYCRPKLTYIAVIIFMADCGSCHLVGLKYSFIRNKISI